MIGFILTLVGAFPVYADANLYYQLTQSDSGTTNAGINASYQQLGTGLSGFITQVYVRFALTTRTSASAINLNFIECSDSGYSVGCVSTNLGNVVSGISGTLPATTYELNLATPYVFYTGKYYKLVYNIQGFSNEVLTISGSSADTWSGGDCLNGNGSGLSGLTDCYFVINGTQTVFDRSYTSAVVPLNGSTTASTLVNYGFDYYAASADSITTWYADFQDLTQSNSFSLYGSASNGIHTVNGTINLTSGHTYKLSGRVCSSDECFGGLSSTFSVVSSTFSIGTTFPSSFSTSSVPLGTLLPVPTIVQFLSNHVSAYRNRHNNQQVYFQRLKSCNESANETNNPHNLTC